MLQNCCTIFCALPLVFSTTFLFCLSHQAELSFCSREWVKRPDGACWLCMWGETGSNLYMKLTGWSLASLFQSNLPVMKYHILPPLIPSDPLQNSLTKWNSENPEKHFAKYTKLFKISLQSTRIDLLICKTPVL